MNTVQSFISNIQHAATRHPYRWSVRKQVLIVLLGIGIAGVIGLIKVSLRYDSDESERWWRYYFTDQLIGWGHWTIWLPLLISFFYTTFSKIKGELKSLLIIFVTLMLVGIIAATVEGLLWHSLFNKRPDWPWPRVWKASISNRFGFHFLVGITTSLLLLARQLWYIARDKREKKKFTSTL